MKLKESTKRKYFKLGIYSAQKGEALKRSTLLLQQLTADHKQRAELTGVASENVGVMKESLTLQQKNDKYLEQMLKLREDELRLKQDELFLRRQELALQKAKFEKKYGIQIVL